MRDRPQHSLPATASKAEPSPDPAPWSPARAAALYGIERWGAPYFSVSETGRVQVTDGAQPPVDLFALVRDLGERGVRLPVLLRFPDILADRVRQLCEGFASVIAEAGYTSRYQAVYPVKVNQQRHVVEALLEAGEDHAVGLEAGSKPELLIALAALDQRAGLVVCNGYKDRAFVEMAIAAQRLDKRVCIVLEQPEELELALECAQRVGIQPMLGVRARLHTRGSGHWGNSSGHRAKFGLTVPQILEVTDRLAELGLAHTLQLLHFHVGSQISEIRTVKDAIREASQLFVELHKLGAGMRYLDVGGGLAVDYDGSQCAGDASLNYDLLEYARDVVYGIQEACDARGVPHPIIVSESGRALTAHQSALIFEVVGANAPADSVDVVGAAQAGEPAVIEGLRATLAEIAPDSLREAWHDALQAKDEAQQLFRFGVIDLRQLGLAEQLFWACCGKIRSALASLPHVPEDLRAIEELCSAIYYCNFSIFQSAPDVWAIGQVFPVLPIHRLDEAPTVNAALADLTCDSDGFVSRFAGSDGSRSVLPLHEVRSGEPYLLGMFLNGAYQETLGDLHNLFGDTQAVHVRLGPEGYAVEHVVPGDTVEQVLRYVHYDPGAMVERVRQQAERALREGHLTLAQVRIFMTHFAEGLSASTYLGDDARGQAHAPLPAAPAGRFGVSREQTSSWPAAPVATGPLATGPFATGPTATGPAAGTPVATAPIHAKFDA